MSASARPPYLNRRALTGAATAGLALPVLAACSGDDSSTAVDPAETAPSSSSGGSGGSSGGADPTRSAAPEGLTATSDIEVGGGTIFQDQEVVITQPTEGEFKCFSAVCTHQGCLVSSVSDGDIHCECHGSAFSIVDGSVVTGPATTALAEQQIDVQGGQITLA